MTTATIELLRSIAAYIGLWLLQPQAATTLAAFVVGYLVRGVRAWTPQDAGRIVFGAVMAWVAVYAIQVLVMQLGG